MKNHQGDAEDEDVGCDVHKGVNADGSGGSEGGAIGARGVSPFGGVRSILRIHVDGRVRTTAFRKFFHTKSHVRGPRLETWR